MTDYTTSIPTNDGFIKTYVEQITLRDQFAMAALTGIAANPEYDLHTDDKVRLAYEIADAMLKRRQKKK